MIFVISSLFVSICTHTFVVSAGENRFSWSKHFMLNYFLISRKVTTHYLEKKLSWKLPPIPTYLQGFILLYELVYLQSWASHCHFLWWKRITHRNQTGDQTSTNPQPNQLHYASWCIPWESNLIDFYCTHKDLSVSLCIQ